MHVRAYLVFVLGLAGTSGCRDDGVFFCSDDGDCAAGQCEPSGFCSFPDPACPSGQRYGELAPETFAGDCVPVVDEPSSGTSGNSTSTGSDSTPATSDDSASASATVGPNTDTVGPTTGLPPPVCGNGVVEAGEDCDGNNLGGATCVDLGFSGGPLGCADCSADTSQCSVCGNELIEEGEACDGKLLRDQACTDLGFFTGNLGCQPDCQGLDLSQCTNCGNGTLESPELCDGEAGLQGCADLGFNNDALSSCTETCDGFDTSGCGLLVCNSDPLPFGECPAACTDCVDDVCVIECDGLSECGAETLDCPPGWPCQVVCDGGSACSNARVNCPPFHRCEVTCTGLSGCSGLELHCGLAGQCNINCDDSLAVCSGADVICGGDACEAVCDGSAPNVECGASCNCTPC